MHKTLLVTIFNCLILSSFAQKNTAQLISSTQDKLWEKKMLTTAESTSKFDVEIKVDQRLQTIEGFGTCFNELGWTSLSILSEKDRQDIFRELFSPGVGVNFTLCRMPIGANDFSTTWYSFNEVEGDFTMKNFSIRQDLKTLVPFIKSAKKFNSSLKVWASPWSPPAWMKYNKHYAMKPSTKYNDLGNGLQGKEGVDMFIQEEAYFKAYTLYFSKFIQAYRDQKININMVMPQNEFVAAQIFPSCTWTAAGLGRFIEHLGPAMKRLNVDVYFGTMNSENHKYVDTIMSNRKIKDYIRGVGFQWAGKDAIKRVYQNYPSLPLYQTEQECGDGKNDWKYCLYTWELMKQYLKNGANAYMYWNTSLKEGGISTWGWKQNSLISVDTISRSYKYNYEYYLMKHLSHYVKPGAKRLVTNGTFDNLMAFINRDKSVVIVLQNESRKERRLHIKVGDKMYSPVLQADSFNTLVVR